ncbi:MAG: potassium transporter Trk [Myxococcales bacterium]|jgi:trk system potassium uptake protein TrkH|nr:potassium transporter Trk [Myxococcales bacterium]
MQFQPYRLNPIQRIRLWWHGLSLPALFVASFALLIALGTAGLLVLPGLYAHERISFFDALVTMTHCVCLTGLTVLDISEEFTFFGQLWLLLFIQMGGLGLFTFSSLLIGALGRRLSLRSELLTSTSLECRTNTKGVKDLARDVARFALLLEGIGAALLWPQLIYQSVLDGRFSLMGIVEALWNAVFLAVTAFCNAGLTLYPNSIATFAERPFVLLPLTALVVLGGFGFLAFEEFLRWWRLGRFQGRHRFSIHTLSVCVVTGAFLTIGFVAFLIFEWSGVLAKFGVIDKLTNALVMSAMSRTAGFASIDYALVSNETAYLTILLMFIGGSPGSTASGIKTTTFAVLMAQAVARIRGHRYVSLFNRSIPDAVVQRASSVVLIAFFILSGVVFILGFTETGCGTDLAATRQNFLPLLFETVSALSTVGLSLGLACPLSSVGKAILVVLMFIGRVGLLAFFSTLSLRDNASPSGFRPAQENIFIG